MGMKFFIDSRSGFNRSHVIKAMLLLGTRKMSRSKIMKELSLNEASARTLLAGMEKNALARAEKKGHVLTQKGRNLFTELSRSFSGPLYFDKSGFGISKHNVCYVVKGQKNKIKKGVEQRDSAVRNGADGLVALVMTDRLVIPCMEKWYVPKELSTALKSLVKRGDVVLIGSAEERIIADLATLNVALDLIE